MNDNPATPIDIASAKEVKIVSSDRTRRAIFYDRLATVLIGVISLVSVVVVVFIVGTILKNGLITALDPAFFAGKPQAIRSGGGIGPMIASSFFLTILTLIIALPVGVGAGTYMAEYAKGGLLTRLLRFGADTLSTVPSIVFGIFGMVLFVIRFGLGYSLLAGALTLTLINLPTILRTTEEAIRSVPDTYREASLGLGASRFQTIKNLILPSAMSGITTGAILAIGRIVGESTALVYTVGIFVRSVPTSPLDPGAPMAANIWHMYTEGALVKDWLRVANGEAAFLLLLILALNLLARLVSWFYEKKLGVTG